MTFQEEQFQEVESAFRKCSEVGSGSLFEVAAEYFKNGLPDVTFALIAHAATIHTTEDPFDFQEKSWAEIHLEAFRRAIYDEQGSIQYGTSHIYYNEGMLRLFTCELIKYAHENDHDDEQFDTTNLPKNVMLFQSASKVRQ